ncbi:MAG: hypothetical protein NVS1B11_32230 [Terriglobales bacterium]
MRDEGPRLIPLDDMMGHREVNVDYYVTLADKIYVVYIVIIAMTQIPSPPWPETKFKRIYINDSVRD